VLAMHVSSTPTKGDASCVRASPVSQWKETSVVNPRLLGSSYVHMHLIKLDPTSKFT
jgi:hypothetical protein